MDKPGSLTKLLLVRRNGLRANMLCSGMECCSGDKDCYNKQIKRRIMISCRLCAVNVGFACDWCPTARIVPRICNRCFSVSSAPSYGRIPMSHSA